MVKVITLSHPQSVQREVLESNKKWFKVLDEKFADIKRKLNCTIKWKHEIKQNTSKVLRENSITQC